MLDKDLKQTLAGLAQEKAMSDIADHASKAKLMLDLLAAVTPMLRQSLQPLFNEAALLQTEALLSAVDVAEKRGLSKPQALELVKQIQIIDLQALYLAAHK